MNLLEADPFQNTFGPKAQRKKPKLAVADLAELAAGASEKLDNYDSVNDKSLPVEDDGTLDAEKNPIFKKGQSKRIWGELYKVIDSSDVIIHVLDARDPMGTRCKNVEKHLKTEARHKHLIFVLNKCDLVPTWVTVFFVNSRKSGKSILKRSIPPLHSMPALPILLVSQP
jgi:nuclear GTP-binding protein